MHAISLLKVLIALSTQLGTNDLFVYGCVVMVAHRDPSADIFA